MNSNTPITIMASGGLNGKNEDDDWLEGVEKDPTTATRSGESNVIEQINLLGNIATCSADINGDGTVDVADLLILIGAWGPCPVCDADLDTDGEVNVADLLILIGAWGQCK